MTEHTDVHDRLDRLESLVDDQQERIDDQEETIHRQQEIIRDQRERIDDLEARTRDDSAGATPVGRREALKAGGVLAALGLGAGATAGGASADPQGQVGDSSDPLQSLYTDKLYGYNGSVGVQESLDFANSDSIQDAGTDAVQFDGNQTVTIPNGDLDMNGNDIVNVGSSGGLWEDAGDDGFLNPAQTGDTGIGVAEVRTDTLTDDGAGQVSMSTTLALGANDVTDVGALSGTTVNTDNLRPNTSSSVTLAGPLDANGNDVTNVGTVDGVDVPAYGGRHSPDGADAVPTGTPVGISDAGNAAGTADAVARADHVHTHGALGSETTGGTPHHSVATASAPGFLSTGDKSKLNNLAADADATYVDESGDTMSGTLDMGSNSINSVGSIDNGGSAISVDDALDFSGPNNIQAAGADALQFDSNQNVFLPNGDLVIESSNSILDASGNTHLTVNDGGPLDVVQDLVLNDDQSLRKVDKITGRQNGDGNLDVEAVTNLTFRFDTNASGSGAFIVENDGGRVFRVNDDGNVYVPSGDVNLSNSLNVDTVSDRTSGSVSMSATLDANGNTVTDAGTIDTNDNRNLTLDSGASNRLVFPNLPSQENSILTVDSSGNVGTSTTGTSNLAGYTGTRAYLGTDQSLSGVSADTDVVVEFDTEAFDPDNNYDTSNFTYTVPSNAVYAVATQVMIVVKADADRILKLQKDTGAGFSDVTGARARTFERTDGQTTTLSLTTDLSLNAGDKLRAVVVFLNSVDTNMESIRAESNLTVRRVG